MSIGEAINPSIPLPPGISFKAPASSFSYQVLKTVSFYNSICTVDAFLNLNSALQANSFNLTSDCLRLKLGQLLLPDVFTHNVHFTGLNKYKDHSITVHSKLNLPRLVIGNFFEMFTSDSSATDFMLYFKSKESELNGFIQNLSISIFDSKLFVEQALIYDSFIIFQGNTTIFSKFDVKIKGKSLILSDMNSMALQINVEILDKAHQFKADLASILNTHTKSTINEITERQKDAQILSKNADSLYEKLLYQYKELKSQQDSLTLMLEDANETMLQWSNIAESKRGDLKDAIEKYNDMHENTSIDSHCGKEECNNICRDGSVCSVCYALSKIVENGICQSSFLRNRSVTQYHLYPFKAWKYETTCHPCWRTLWLSLPHVSIDSCCVTESIPYNAYRQEPFEGSEYYTDIQSKTCVTGTFEEQTSEYCCTEQTCSQKTLNSSCIIDDVECQENFQRILVENETQDQNVQKKHLDYLFAKENFTLSKVNLTTIETKLFIINQELELIAHALHTASHNRQLRKQALEDIMKVTKMFNQFINSFNHLANNDSDIIIHTVTFDATLTSTTPVSLPVNFMYEYGNIEDEITVIINFQNSLEAIYHQVSTKILNKIIGDSASRQRRQTSQSTVENNLSIGCSEIVNIKSFIEQVSMYLNHSHEKFNQNLANIDKIFLPTSMSMQHSSQYGEFLLNQLSKSNVETNQFIDRLRKFVAEYSFFQWQSMLDILYGNGSSVNGIGCFSSSDCLLIALYDLILLVEETPVQEAEAIKQSIVLAKENALQVTNNYTYSFINAKSSLEILLNLVSDIEKLGYWCSDLPTFEKQPPLEVNITAGDTLELEYVVSSSLPVQYHWTRNSLLLSSTTNKLVVPDVQPSEEGTYRCTVTSDAGSISSPSTTVNVFLYPILNHSLEASYETYEGSDNPIFLRCDANARPSPGWKWFYQASKSDSWKEIENSETNTLVILKPNLQKEGWYTCMAYNWIGNVTSTPTYLWVLTAEVVSIQYPISLVLNVETAENNGTFTMDTELEKKFTNEIVQMLNLSMTSVDVFEFVLDDHSLIHISFLFTTPHIEYNASINIVELLTIVVPAIQELETSISTLSNNFDLIEMSGIKFQPVTNSLSIGPRHFRCRNGYGVHSNRLICSRSNVTFIKYLYYFCVYNILYKYRNYYYVIFCNIYLSVACGQGKHSGPLGIEYVERNSGIFVKQMYSQCVECPVGYYQDIVGRAECQRCPINHSTPSTGTSLDSQCIGIYITHVFLHRYTTILNHS